MDNHFHLIIRTIDNGATIDVIMQYIKSKFAKKYNKMMNRTGPCRNERYKDKVVELTHNPEQYLYNLLLYLGYNPVKEKIVSNPRHYKYSSFNYYVNINYHPPLKLTIHYQFKNLGKSINEQINNFIILERYYREKIYDSTVYEFYFRK